MLTASIISLNILVLIFIVISLKQRKHRYKNPLDSDIELETDLDKLSTTHFLLEAGKNEWRLNEKQYNDPHALIIYTLGLIFNNPIIYFDTEKLRATLNRIRLPFLLDTYTDKHLFPEQRVHDLSEIFFEQREALEPRLQELYHLPSKDSDTSSHDLIDTLNLILRHAK